jgi:acyl-CoA thioesterase-1
MGSAQKFWRVTGVALPLALGGLGSGSARAATALQSLWGSGGGGPESTGVKAAEVGVKFRSDAAGYVYGLRFFKTEQNSGSHIGSLWDRGGRLLARAAFSNETSSGWHEVLFVNPIAIKPKLTYVASYFSPAGHYAATPGFFKRAAFIASPLRALKSGQEGKNGVLRVAGAPSFPKQGLGPTNYWVDVLFSTAAPVSEVNFPTSATLGGKSVTGTVRLSAATPVPVSVDLTLTQGEGVVTDLPSTVTVPAGQSTASFDVRTSMVSGLTDVQVRADTEGSTHFGAFKLRPPGPKRLGLIPGVVPAGQPAGAYLYMEAPVPVDTRVDIQVVNPTWATVPAFVIVPAGSDFANFGTITSPLLGASGAQIVILASTPWRATAGLVCVTGGSAAFVPAPENPSLPRVLLIGDSVSVGYTQGVRDNLTGKANVQRAPTNCASSNRIITNLDEWIHGSHWNVIHFNCGLWDIQDLPNGSPSVPIDEYEQNLREIVTRLKATGAILIWANTTPAPPADAGLAWSNTNVLAYNAAAHRVMQEMGVVEDDLYGFVDSGPPGLQIPGNIHFTPIGYQALAGKVASSIQPLLPH